MQGERLAGNGPRAPVAVLTVVACLAFAMAEPAFCGWQTFTTGANSILEDRARNLWFATSRGVSRYDGVTWRTFTSADGLASNSVLPMLEDRSGNLWFGTYDGVSRYDGSTWRTFTPDGLVHNQVFSLLEDRAGNLWFGTTGAGVSRYDGVTWRTFTTADGLAGNYVYSILEDRAGNLWFATAAPEDETGSGWGTGGTGVSRYDGSTWRTFTTADGLADNNVSSILEDGAGDLWFGTWGGGVSRYDGATWRTFTTTDGLTTNDVNSIAEDRAGNLWFGTSGGVGRYDGATWRTFTTADGLAHNYVTTMLEDRAGNVWFGGGGLSRYDGAAWRNFTTADGLASNNVFRMLEERAGNLWFATGEGASRYDGSTWRTFTKADGLAGNYVTTMLEDRAGNLWFGTYGGGVSRYDGTTWRTFTKADGLADSVVYCIMEDRTGNLWFGTYGGGVSRYDGTTWRTFTRADGLAGHHVTSMLEDGAGTLWFGTGGAGVSRYDGVSWRKFHTADGLANNQVFSILEDRAGNLWFGTYEGVSRYDGSTWRTFTTADGLAGNLVGPMLEDRAGNLWVGTQAGVNRYDGVTWRTFTTADGLVGNQVYSILEDRARNLWFATYSGASRYEPDRVPPRTVFLSAPPRLSPARNHSAVFTAAFGETRIEFSYQFDGSPWSGWSSLNSWFGNDLFDGIHHLEVRSRDFLTNVEQSPLVATFEVDATPPAPVIAAPFFNVWVRGVVEIRGSAADPRFARYGVAVRRAGAPSWNPPDATPLVESTTPVADGLLATWDTSSLPDGSYEIRLAVSDTLGLTASDLVTVRVDNHAPFDEQTAPARVYAATGGDIYTLNGELHLYFPPHAFGADAQVTIDPVVPDSVPETLPSGAVRVLAGYEVGWRGATLEKAVRLEVSLGGLDPGAVSGGLALYASTDGTSWRRLGGTVEEGARRISLAVSEPGRYALYAETASPAGERALSGLSFTPRVFSPTGGFADREVGIGFVLGQAGSVTVRVYSRAGWLVREVARGVSLGSGANLVRWDGRNREGSIVADGLYLVTVEALGQTKSQALAVVR